MSYLPGGVAGKLGNRYEAKWVVKQYVLLLREQLRSVTLEAIGDANEGVDIWVLQNDDIRMAFQCKGRSANDDKWAVSTLAPVLHKAQKQLSYDSSSLFRLVSPLPFTLLTDLTQNARTNLDCGPESQFNFLSSLSRDNAQVIIQLSSVLSIDVNTPQGKQDLIFFLKRFDQILYSDQQDSFNDLKAWLEVLLTGDGDASFAVLRDFAEKHLGESVTAPELFSYLSDLGIMDENNRIWSPSRLTTSGSSKNLTINVSTVLHLTTLKAYPKLPSSSLMLCGTEPCTYSRS